MRSCAALIGLLLVATTATPSQAQERRILLPSARAQIQERIRAEELLRNGQGPERTLPGPVTDSEVVNVTVDPSGTPISVNVSQRLRLGGTGDFFVRIPGPVIDVSPGLLSSSQPSLRNGSIVWQGFAEKGDVLAADARLDPGLEKDRLPLRIGIERSSNVLELTVENASGSLVSIQKSSPPIPALARALDEVRADLRAGVRPDPGRGGVPRSLPVSGRVRNVNVQVTAPFRVRAQVVFDTNVPGLKAPGALIARSQGKTSLTYVRTLDASRGSFASVIRAPKLPTALPTIGVMAEPSAPHVRALVPPNGHGSWNSALRAETVTPEVAFDRLIAVLSSTAQLPNFDGYLGNPDRDGPTSTVYRYLVQAQPVVADKDQRDGDTSAPFPPILLLGGLLLVLLAAFAWRAYS